VVKSASKPVFRAELHMAKVFATCSLCRNFDPNRQTCGLTNKTVNPIDPNESMECEKNGQFIRDINVIPQSYNFFLEPEDVPLHWTFDDSRLPKDQNGVALFVHTKRGTERIIPVEGYTKPLIGCPLGGVDKIYTYQGQRELIYDLGAELAKAEAEKMGVPLQILEGEENSMGQKLEIRRHLVVQRNTEPNPWLNNGEAW